MSLNANHVTNLLNIDGTTVDLVDINSGIEAFKAQISQGRLTLTSNTPVLSSSVTGATTLYYTPYTGNQISIWDGSKWSVRTFTELSLSLSGLAANTNYDVFIYDNTGTLTLEAVAWSNSGAGTSARASALSWLNGVRVKNSDNRKYLGSFRTTATIGQTGILFSGIPPYLFIINEFNRIKGNFINPLSLSSILYTWIESGATLRPVYNSSNSKIDFISDLSTTESAGSIYGGLNSGNGVGVKITSSSLTFMSRAFHSSDVQITGQYTGMTCFGIDHRATGYNTITLNESKFSLAEARFTIGANPNIYLSADLYY